MTQLHQFFEPVSCTYTYLLIEQTSGEAVIIDPVDVEIETYLQFMQQHQLSLKYVLETHAHADHITSAGRICQLTGARAATPMHCNITPAELQLVDGQEIQFGDHQTIVCLHTPGHTAGSMSFYWKGNLFTGDALLINGCGRTDFQSGDAATLYRSITQKLFSYPDSTKVYPGHDYHGNRFSTVGDEKANNSRLAGKTEQAFIALMAALNLPKPKMIDQAVPANLKLGLIDGDAAEIHAAE